MKCDICGGRREKTDISYNIFYRGRPVIIENVPAEVCQQCGEEYFDPDTVEMLQKVVWSQKKPKRTIETPVFDLSAISP